VSKVFRPSSQDPWRRNAVVGGHFAEPGSYEFTFAEAAKELGNRAIETGLLDFYFYPMCFLFRHAFELTLKSLAVEAERLLIVLNELGETKATVDIDELEERLRTHKKAHSLQWLLNQLEPRLTAIPECRPLPQEVRSAIAELHNVDPHGVTFRYWVDRTGKRSLEQTGLVDVKRVRDELGEAHELLFYGLGSWLYETRASATELLNELSAEYAADPDGAGNG
jgi:hypothetical protein